MKLAITLGDVNGVGPEILLKAFAHGDLPWPLVVAGDLAALEACNEALGYGVALRSVRAEPDPDPAVLGVLDQGLLARADIEPGTLSARAGDAAFHYLQQGIRLAQDGAVDAIVTLPMNKEATRLTHPGFSGHTGVVAEACGSPEHTMALISDDLIVAHVSTHVSLRQAIESLSTQRILAVIRMAHDAARRLGRPPRMAVMGLNPHAGEGGSFGDEEATCIRPAVEQAVADGLDVVGPLPPDTVFMRARKGDFSSVVAMYHDQGHIAMKTIGMDNTVNVTLGLPFVRTSVDHGTAFDIAYRGTASTGSFIKACRLAVELAGAG